MTKHEKTKKGNIFFRLFIIALFLVATIGIVKIASNYLRDDIVGKTNVIINNTNVTKNLKKDAIVQNEGVVYLSKSDIANFFDPYIEYDKQYNQIITGSDDKIASLKVGEQQITINSANTKIKAGVIQKDEQYYIPFSELENVYNVKVKYISETNTFVIDSLDRDYAVVTSNKKNTIKYKPNLFARAVESVNAGDNLVVANRSDYPVPDGWMRVRTTNGKLGYIKTDSVGQVNSIRQAVQKEEKMQGKVSLVWDSYSQYVNAPTRTGTIEGVNVVSPSFFYLEKLGKGNLKTNIGTQGQAYINWAKSNNYQVWPMVTNDSMIDTTSEIMKDYKLREKLINQIVSYVVEYKLDGINIDFENMYEEDKSYFSRFIIELAPRLNEIGAVLSVDVTAPDGASTWSMCYDRNVIGKVADYIVFMAYDQNGASSPKEGTTAGLNWVEANVKKFLGQEGVKSEKLILGIPFYTRLWKEQNGKVTSDVVNSKNIDSVIPTNVQKTWLEDLGQNYVEYSKNGATYKMWLEDEKSISAKLDLVEKYKLAGASYWEKNRENTGIWSIVSQKLGL